MYTKCNPAQLYSNSMQR